VFAPRLHATLMAFGQGETGRPAAVIFGYTDPRPMTGAARRFRFDVEHRLHRDLCEIERMVVALGSKRLASAALNAWL